jgi:hypothetical protein
MKKHIALLLGGAELLAAAAVGLTVRAAPAHAAPTQNGANLFVTQTLADPGVIGTRSSATTTAQTTVCD